MCKFAQKSSFSALFSKDIILRHFEENYLKLFPQYFRYSNYEKAAEVTEIIKNKYIGKKKLNESFHEVANVSIMLISIKFFQSLYFSVSINKPDIWVW